MIIPILKESYLCTEEDFIYFLENLYQIFFSEFLCETNVDCNQKGNCTDQKCECISGWDSQKDCESKC